MCKLNKINWPSIINSMQDVVFVITPDLLVEEINESGLLLLGIKLEDAIGKKCHDVFFDNETKCLDCPFIEPDPSNNTIAVDNILEIKGKTFSIKSTPITDSETQKPIRFINILRDITAQKQAEKELKKVESKYRNLFELANDAIYVADANTGKILEANKKACELIGRPLNELIGMHQSQLHPKEDKAKAIQIFLNHVQNKGNTPTLSQIHVINKSGEKIPVEINPTIIDSFDGNKTVIGIFRDITERKKAEQKIKESEEKYFSMFHNAPLPYQSLDENGCFKDVNPAWIKTLGYSIDEITGKWFGAYLHPDYVSQFKSNFPEFKKIGYVKDVHFKIRKKSGQFIDVSFEGCAGYTSEGKFRQTYCVFKDVTEEYMVKEALKNSEHKFRLLFKNMNTGFAYHKIITDANNKPIDYIFLDINPAFEKLTGLNRKKIINKKLTEVLPDIEEFWVERYGEVALTGKPTMFTSYSKDLGKYYEVKSYSPQKGYFAVIFSDITERKNTEEKFTKAFHTSVDLFAISTVENGIYLEVNDAFLSVMGYKREEVIGKSSKDIGIWIEKGRREKILRQVAKNRFCKDIEVTVKNKKGQPIYGLFSISYINISGKEYLLTMMKDITIRKKNEMALQESQEKFKAIIEGGMDGILAFDTKTRKFVLANPAMSRLTGYSLDELVGRNLADIYPQEEFPEILKLFESQLDGNTRVIRDIPILTKNKELVYCDINNSLLTLKGNKMLVGFFRDVTERRKAEEWVFNAILETEEKERRQFAENLHDELGPFLSGIKLYINNLKNDTITHERRMHILGDVEEMIDESIAKTREISNKLMPHVLLDFGLVKALESFIDKINATRKIAVILHDKTINRIANHNIELVVYRIVIELLNNTLKHANAKTAIIELLETKNTLKVNYSDNGKGFDVEKALQDLVGQGLKNIHDRLKSINAKKLLESNIGNGMQFYFEIVLKE